VLLVEDNPGDARLIREGLAEAAETFEVLHVDRLNQALTRLEQERVDIVLLDLGLPDAQGRDSFVYVHHRAPDVPVVILTGLVDEDLAVRLVREGAQDYLFKGQASGAVLVRSIRYAIERKKLLRRLEEALGEVKTLSGLLPICAECKKVRDDRGYWNQIERYIEARSGAQFTHGLCPECVKKLYPKDADFINNGTQED